MITKEELKEALPAQLKTAASDDLVNKINRFASDPDFAETLRDNIMSYTSVLKEGRFKVSDYINAVTYVSLKLMNFSNQKAWATTFPKRYQDLRANGADDKVISAYVSAYNKGKLVNLILEQTLVPTWVLNQDIYQKAINHQAHLMLHANSEKVQQEAANSLLTHLKKPEKQQVELNLGVKEDSGMVELRNMLTELAQRQQELIGQGVNTREVAHQKLPSGSQIEGEFKDVTPKK